MKKIFMLWNWGILLMVAILLIPAHGMAQEMTVGAGSFSLAEKTGANHAPLQAYYYRPAAWHDGRPIVVVFHGLKRNAREYCEGLRSCAEGHNFLVVCPEFSESKYPGARYYNIGNVIDRGDKGGK